MGLSEMFYAGMLFKKVKWCIANITNSYDHEEQNSLYKLRNALYRVQHQLSIREECRLISEEKDHIDLILTDYQRDLVQQYLKGYLANYKNNEEEYFIITLNQFLSKHQDDHMLANTKMFDSEEMEGGKSYERWHRLTDLGKVYYKMFYITQAKCIALHGKPIGEDSLANRVLTNCAEAIITGGFKILID